MLPLKFAEGPSSPLLPPGCSELLWLVALPLWSLPLSLQGPLLSVSDHLLSFCFIRRLVIGFMSHPDDPSGHPSARAGDTRDMDLIPDREDSPGVGNGNPLQYSCLENPMDRGALQATVHGITKIRRNWVCVCAWSRMISSSSNSLHLQRPFFWITLYSQIPGVRMFTYLLAGHHFSPPESSCRVCSYLPSASYCLLYRLYYIGWLWIRWNPSYQLPVWPLVMLLPCLYWNSLSKQEV